MKVHTVAFNLIALGWVTALTVFVCAAEARTPGFATQEACVVHLEKLRQDKSANPLNALESVNALIDYSERKNWQKAYLYASTYKVELLVKQDDISQAGALYEQILPLAQRMADPLIAARLTMASLKIRFALGDVENISDSYVALLERADATENPAEKGEIHLAIGLSEQGNLRLADAIRSYNVAYEFFESIDDSVSKALVLNSLADAYNNLGDKDRAIEYFTLALGLHQNVGDKFGESVVLYNLGRSYLDKGDLQPARVSFTKALQISEEINDAIGVAWAKSALAKVALKNERWGIALEYLEDAEPVFADVGDRQSRFECVLSQANAYLGAGDIEQAEKKLAQSKALMSPARSVSGYYHYNDTDSRIALARGDYKRAYEGLEKKFEWVKEHTERDKDKQVQRFKTEFDTQLKEKQNQVLRQENELKQLKILEQQRKQKVWILAILLAMLLLLFLAMLLYFQTRNRNRFKALAMRDHLTDSPNRRAILQFAQERLAEAASTDSPLVLGIADLDSFKKLNDSFGHDAGDEVLRNFALACSTALRKQDGFGRYGGEEWLIVLPDTNLSQIAGIFDRLRAHLNGLSAKGVPDGHYVTFSMGVAQYDRSRHKNIDALIKRADEKLYKAKENGRNQFQA